MCQLAGLDRLLFFWWPWTATSNTLYHLASPWLTPGWNPEGPAQKNSQQIPWISPTAYLSQRFFLNRGVVSEFYSPDTFTIKYKSSTRSWLSVPRNFIQEGSWYISQKLTRQNRSQTLGFYVPDISVQTKWGGINCWSHTQILAYSGRPAQILSSIFLV